MSREEIVKVIAKPPKARNPLVVAARFRQAGRHRKSTQAERQQNKRALVRELALQANGG